MGRVEARAASTSLTDCEQRAARWWPISQQTLTVVTSAVNIAAELAGDPDST
jgi:hypothetical protein